MEKISKSIFPYLGLIPKAYYHTAGTLAVAGAWNPGQKWDCWDTMSILQWIPTVSREAWIFQVCLPWWWPLEVWRYHPILMGRCPGSSEGQVFWAGWAWVHILTLCIALGMLPPSLCVSYFHICKMLIITTSGVVGCYDGYRQWQ